MNHFRLQKVLSLGVSLPQRALWSLVEIEETTSPCLNMKKEESAGINSLKTSLQKTAVRRGFQVYDPQWKKALAHHLEWNSEYQRREGVTLPGVTSYLLQLDMSENSKVFTSLQGWGSSFYAEVRHFEIRLLASIDTYIIENKQIKFY